MNSDFSEAQYIQYVDMSQGETMKDLVCILRPDQIDLIADAVIARLQLDVNGHLKCSLLSMADEMAQWHIDDHDECGETARKFLADLALFRSRQG